MQGHLSFAELFATDPALPVKIEVGSGTGEWAVAQAKAAEGRANWCTVELRTDRVAATFSRAVLSGAHNLAVVGSDAHGFL